MIHKTKEWVEAYFIYDKVTGEVRLKRRIGRGQRGSGLGYIDDLGYRRFYLQGRYYRAHQIAWLFLTGEWSSLIDHKDEDKLNNKSDNLREATKSQNAANRRQVKGISKCSSTGKYRASITFQGKSVNLGRFWTIEEATEAYRNKRSELFGRFAP